MFDMTIADATELATAPAIAAAPGHDHGLNAIVGYVVRYSVLRGGTIAAPLLSHRPGADVAIFRSPTLFGAAVAAANMWRVDSGWAVVDSVYACGCRS